MKTAKVIKLEQPVTYQIKIQMLGGKRATMEFTDQRQAQDIYDMINNNRVFYNEAVRQIELNEI